MPEDPKYLSWSLISTWMSYKLENIFLWFLKVSCIARRSKIPFLKLNKSWNALQLQNIIFIIFKSLLDCQKVRKTFLKFSNSMNVWEASKYFSMIFESLLYCQKVQDNFPEVWQVQECLASFKILFYEFQKSPGLPEGPR